MRAFLAAFLTIALFGSAALADSWKDESGKKRWKEYSGGYAEYDREYKEEFWVGNCKIERKWERDGEYKEERKCKNYWD